MMTLISTGRALLTAPTTLETSAMTARRRLQATLESDRRLTRTSATPAPLTPANDAGLLSALLDDRAAGERGRP